MTKVKLKSYLSKEAARDLLLKSSTELVAKEIVIKTKRMEYFRPLVNNERLARWSSRYYLTGEHRRV